MSVYLKMAEELIMKKSILSCLFLLVFSTVVFGDLAYFTVEKRVQDNNLIIIGTLKNVVETETQEFEISNGTLEIEKVLYGNYSTASNQKLKSGDKLPIEWRNSKMFACKFGFSENESGIWFLNVDNIGEIEQLHNNSSSSLDELSEVKKHLKKKGIDKVSKKIQLQNDVQETNQSELIVQDYSVKCLYSTKQMESNGNSPFSAFLVILASITLYYILYRSRFKIR
jgi:hypothetical protein